MKDLTVLVGTVGQSIMRSEDDGATWVRVGPRRGFPYEASVRCLAMNPHNSTTVFAGTEKGLYRSDDGGAGWNRVDSVLNGPKKILLGFGDFSPGSSGGMILLH